MTQSDTLFIEGFEVLCRVGETAEERSFPQIITISIHCDLSLQKAGKQDDLKETVDYARLVDLVKNKLSEKSFVLVEAVAEQTAETILSFKKIVHTEVKVSKRSFPGINSAGVIIRRSR